MTKPIGLLISVSAGYLAAMDMRRTFLVGLSLLAGLSVEVTPGLYQQMPASIRVLFDSPITVFAMNFVGRE